MTIIDELGFPIPDEVDSVLDEQRREAEGRYFAVHMFYLATAVRP